MEFVSREELLAATALPWEAVFLPALKKSAVVVGMSGKARDSFEGSLVKGKGKARDVSTDNIRAKLAARCLYDAPPEQGGKRIFTDAEADALGNIRVDILSPIFAVAQKLSGVTDEDLDELGKKSSDEATGSTSPSL